MSDYDLPLSTKGSSDRPANAKKPPRRGDNAKAFFFVALVAALVFYAVSYTAIEGWRSRKGSWEVTFMATATNSLIAINQHRLGITNRQILFAHGGKKGSTVNQATSTPDFPTEKVVFKEARPVPFDLPFGRCVFLDTTFLPGTVTMQLFGHEIELLPRTLIVDHQEHAWTSVTAIELMSN